MAKPLLILSETHRVKKLLRVSGLNTVCEEARCPNISECFGHGTATFMILGDRCTRRCRFCNVKKEPPKAVDREEPKRLLKAVKALGLEYVVITSVARDDLPDGGASHFASCIRLLKKYIENIKVEVLIPDFRGSEEAIATVLKEKPDVLNHNIETVPRLYPYVRIGSKYERSLRVLRMSKEIAPDIPTKSALILGFGESWEEILQTMEDLRKTGCDFLTIGQYYQPSREHFPVVKFYSEEEFAKLGEIAYSMGFRFVASGNKVRSSYRAWNQFLYSS
jgi:lipoic acid synthetase